MTILAYLYFILAVIYLSFGIFYKHLESKVPTFFPLLDYTFKGEMTKRFWLVWDSLALFGVGYLLLTGSPTGTAMAIVLSTWEVFLSYMFYWVVKKDKVQAWGHFIIHLAIIIFICSK